MSKIRLKFSKLSMGKYISHLDLLRTFTRAIHRADLPVRYSQGFNPHQLLTFSLPLALGTTSETEFVDIDFEEGTDILTVVRKLNECLPPDIRILEGGLPTIKAKDIISAEYLFDVCLTQAVDYEMIERFFSLPEIITVKKTKRGEKEVNLRDFIYEYEMIELTEEHLKLRAVISAGGENNIKPGLVAYKLCEFIKSGTLESTEIHRTRIMYTDGNRTLEFK